MAIYKVFFNNLIKVHQDTAGQPCKRKSLFGFFAKEVDGLRTYCSAELRLSLIYFVNLSSVMLILVVFFGHQNAVKKKKKKNVLPCLVVRQTAFSL